MFRERGNAFVGTMLTFDSMPGGLVLRDDWSLLAAGPYDQGTITCMDQAFCSHLTPQWG